MINLNWQKSKRIEKHETSRCFKEDKLLIDSDLLKDPSKIESPSFLIRIHFTQHANWQGTIQWLDINKTVAFRSVLELINLLNEGVKHSFNRNGKLDFHSWEGQDLVLEFDIGKRESCERGDMNERQKTQSQ